jgi:L-aminopeptidase/D-esterase-like protein
VSLTAIAGVRVGHWTDAEARTGCTVVLLPGGTIASGEVRGGAPGTREWALLAPERAVDRIDAVVLAGGSAFGLAACDGVVRFCEERGLGFPTRAGPVPIVVGAVLFDLGVGDSRVRPGPAEGYAACVTASTAPVAGGAIGAGTGATVSKWRGADGARPGGVGSAIHRHDDVTVAALVAVNAFGDVLPTGQEAPVDVGGSLLEGAPFQESTTIGIVVTNAVLTKSQCLLVAQGGHDGLARAVAPVHTQADGDAFVGAATGEVPASADLVRALATRAVEDAIRAAAG